MSLGSVVKEATDVYLRLRASGMARPEAFKSLEAVLREVWPKPKGRTEPWKYYCADCGDTGWRPELCTKATPCGRPFKMPRAGEHDWTGRGKCTENHEYCVPCFCSKGQARRAQLEHQAQPEDFTAAGKSRPMTRIGR